MEISRKRDKDIKSRRNEITNSSKYKNQYSFKIGDKDKMRNFRRKSKFEPISLPDEMTTVEVLKNGCLILIKVNYNLKKIFAPSR